MVTITTYCGLDCGKCEYKEQCNCGCCVASGGNPFWAAGEAKCEIAECVKGRGIRFCGECGEFPCEVLKRYSFDKEQGDEGARIENCKAVKTALVQEAREGMDSVSVCGHHCDYCFLGQWCGSCRSDYNCCSFATLFEDKKCPNVKCAGEKGYDGCYDCPELESCQKGYYGKKDEYAAKATALFIRKHGKEQYGETLNRAILQGLQYAGDLDAAGSVEEALKLLETYC